MKRTLLCIVAAVLLLSVAFSAQAITLTGANSYGQVASATKTTTTDKLEVTISQAYVENVDLYMYFYVMHVPTWKQSSASYHIYDGDVGVQDRMYHVNTKYIVVGDKYSAYAKSNPEMEVGEISIMSLSRFVP